MSWRSQQSAFRHFVRHSGRAENRPANDVRRRCAGHFGCLSCGFSRSVPQRRVSNEGLTCAECDRGRRLPVHRVPPDRPRADDGRSWSSACWSAGSPRPRPRPPRRAPLRSAAVRCRGRRRAAQCNCATATHQGRRDRDEGDDPTHPLPFGGGHGTTPGNPAKGLDCSGFVRWVYAQVGWKLPAGSGESVRRSGAFVKTSHPVPGDLVFFGSSAAYHVGIYISPGKFVDSSHPGSFVGLRKIYRGVMGYYHRKDATAFDSQPLRAKVTGSVTVRSATGAAVAGGIVSVYTGPSCGQWVTSLRTNSRGRVSIAVLAGRYCVALTSAPHGYRTTAKVAVTARAGTPISVSIRAPYALDHRDDPNGRRHHEARRRRGQGGDLSGQLPHTGTRRHHEQLWEVHHDQGAARASTASSCCRRRMESSRQPERPLGALPGRQELHRILPVHRTA